jgi:hypothetical protein
MLARMQAFFILQTAQFSVKIKATLIFLRFPDHG